MARTNKTAEILFAFNKRDCKPLIFAMLVSDGVSPFDWAEATN